MKKVLYIIYLFIDILALGASTLLSVYSYKEMVSTLDSKTGYIFGLIGSIALIIALFVIAFMLVLKIITYKDTKKDE